MSKSMTQRCVGIRWNFLNQGFIVILLCLCHCNADKVFVGCSIAGRSHVFSSDCHGNLTQLTFTEIATLDLDSDLTGITHDPSTNDIFIAERDKTSSKECKIVKVDADTGSVGAVIVLPPSVLTGICFYNDMLFWTDYYGDGGTIYSCDIDGTNKTSITETAVDIYGIDIDEVEGSIYYVKFQDDTLTKASLDGQLNEDIVTNFTGIRSVEVDPIERMIYAASTLGQIIRYDLSTDVINDYDEIYNSGEFINSISSVREFILYTDRNGGVKGIAKSGETLQLDVTGLEACSSFDCIHVIPDDTMCNFTDIQTTTTQPSTSNEMTTTRRPTTKASSTLTTMSTNIATTTRDQTDPISTNPIVEDSKSQSFGNSDGVTETKVSTQYQVTSKTEKSVYEFENRLLQEMMIVDDILDIWENINSDFPDLLGSPQQVNGKYTDMHLYEANDLDERSWYVNLTDRNQSYNIAISFGIGAWEDTEGYKLVASVLKWNFEPTTDVNNALGSRIISITMFNKNENTVPYASGKLFNITFSLIPNSRGNPSCRFLTSSMPREWSAGGCFVSASDSSHVTCSCNHMTSFAVLMSFDEDFSYQYSSVVEKVVSVGSIMSILSLLIGLTICVILWKRSQIDREKLLIHAILMTSMVISYAITFVWIVSKQLIRANPNGCFAFMIVRYHVFMTMICTMFVEAVHLFRMIIVVFGANKSYRSVYVAICVGLPMLITGTVAAIGRGNMHSVGSCWLTGSFIWSFVGPVEALLMVNVTILVIVVRQTIKVSQQLKPPDELASFRIGLRCAWLLNPMLGVTWLLAPLGNLNIVVAYFFDILTSLQGIYLVFVTCYVNSEVRNIVKREWARRNGGVEAINLRPSPLRKTDDGLPPPN